MSNPGPDGGMSEPPQAAYGEAATYEQPPPERQERPWSGGRVVTLVLGSLLALFSLGLLAGGVAVLAFDLTQRDANGYLVTDTVEFESNGYAIVGSGLEIDTSVPGWVQVQELIGEVELRVEATGGERVFVGVARESEAEGYLADIGYDEIDEISGFRGVEVTYLSHSGGPPESQPAEQDFWTASTEGRGTQTLTFEPQEGRWVIVAMNADGSPDVSVSAAVAVEAPSLPWVAVALLIAGALAMLVAALIIYLAVRR